MTTIPVVFATTYAGVCGTGRNRPCRFICINEQNKSIDYVVKFFGIIGSTIIFEVVAALLGKQLGIQVPEPAIVHIDQRMANNISDRIARENLLKNNGPHYGSRDLGTGLTIINKGYNLTNESLEQAINIFAFDMLIQNADRTIDGTVGNPNILFKGHNLYPIDHELAFEFVNLIGYSRQPWELRGSGLPQRHVFYRQLKRYAQNHEMYFESFVEKLHDVPSNYFDSVKQALPIEWYNELYLEKLNDYFDAVFDDIDLFHKGLLEVFI